MDWTCPHCGAAGIKWADKKRCAIYGTRCKCAHCGGFSQEARRQRTTYSLLLYGLYILFGMMAAALFALVDNGGDEAMLFIGLPLMGGLWLFFRYAITYSSAMTVPLVPIFPSPRWERFKDIFGTTFGILMLVVLALSLVVNALRL